MPASSNESCFLMSSSSLLPSALMAFNLSSKLPVPRPSVPADEKKPINIDCSSYSIQKLTIIPPPLDATYTIRIKHSHSRSGRCLIFIIIKRNRKLGRIDRKIMLEQFVDVDF